MRASRGETNRHISGSPLTCEHTLVLRHEVFLLSVIKYFLTLSVLTAILVCLCLNSAHTLRRYSVPLCIFLLRVFFLSTKRRGQVDLNEYYTLVTGSYRFQTWSCGSVILNEKTRSIQHVSHTMRWAFIEALDRTTAYICYQ